MRIEGSDPSREPRADGDVLVSPRVNESMPAAASRQVTPAPAPPSKLSDRFAWIVLELAPDGILVTDESGRVLFVNQQAERLFGYDRDELLETHVERLLPEELRSRHRNHRRGFDADPRTRPMGTGLDLRGRRRDGSEFPIDVSLSPIRTQRGMRTVAVVREHVVHQGHGRVDRTVLDVAIQRLFRAGLTLQNLRKDLGPMSVDIGNVLDDLDEAVRVIRGAVLGEAGLQAPASRRR
jgi:PAS domain S-box-containing protein